MNYIGSKYSLLDFLETTITKVTGYKDGNDYIFADLFAGTGVVGKRYKEKGYRVISNDIQYYSYVLNKHYIENTSKLDTDLLEVFNNIKPVEGFVYNNYCAGSGSGRNYFSDENGMKCDAIRIELERLYLTGQINTDLYFYYLASLINSIDKYANTASIYGAFLKKIKKSAQKEFKLELLPIIYGSTGKVYNENANELIRRIEGDILYLDPPYNSRQYCSNYHVLETIAKYDYPILRGITGLRDSSNQKSRFCLKKSAVREFEDLIKNADFKYIFLSYNNEGLMSIDTIKEVMQKYGEYQVFTKKHKRFQSSKIKNDYSDNFFITEYLHCLTKSRN